MGKVRRGVIAIAALILLLAAIAIYFYIAQTKDSSGSLSTPQVSQSPMLNPFKDWKTYRNTNQNFTLMYPPGLYLKEYPVDAVDFLATDPASGEATPGAIKIRYSSQTDKADVRTFEKIYNSNVGEDIKEPLDVKSIITKLRVFQAGAYPAVEYVIDRHFSALEGPKGEYSYVYEINKDGVILKFISNADSQQEGQLVEEVFWQIISSLQFF